MEPMSEIRTVRREAVRAARTTADVLATQRAVVAASPGLDTRAARLIALVAVRDECERRWRESARSWLGPRSVLAGDIGYRSPESVRRRLSPDASTTPTRSRLVGVGAWGKAGSDRALRVARESLSVRPVAEVLDPACASPQARVCYACDVMVVALSEAITNEVAACHDAGVTWRSIAAAVGMSTGGVVRLYKDSRERSEGPARPAPVRKRRGPRLSWPPGELDRAEDAAVDLEEDTVHLSGPGMEDLGRARAAMILRARAIEVMNATAAKVEDLPMSDVCHQVGSRKALDHRTPATGPRTIESAARGVWADQAREAYRDGVISLSSITSVLSEPGDDRLRTFKACEVICAIAVTRAEQSVSRVVAPGSAHESMSDGDVSYLTGVSAGLVKRLRSEAAAHATTTQENQ